MLTPRFRGTSSPQPQASQEVPLGIQMPDSTLIQQGQQAVSALQQGLQESTARASQTFNQAYENMASASSNIAQGRASMALRGGRGASGFAGFAEGLGTLAEAYAQVKEIEAKKKEAELKAIQDQAWVSVNRELENFVTNSESIVRGSGGYPAWQRGYEQIIGQYRAYLSPDQQVELERRVYDTVQPIVATIGGEVRDYTREQMEARRATVLADARLQLSTRMAEITQPMSPQQLIESTGAYQSELYGMLQSSGLAVEDQRFVVNELLTQLADAASSGNVVLRDQYVNLANFAGFLERVQNLQREFYSPDSPNAGRIDVYEASILTSAQEMGVDLSLAQQFVNPNVQSDYEYAQWQRTQNIQSSQRQVRDRALTSVTLDRDQISFLAWTFARDPNSVAAYSQYQGIPAIAQAIAVGESLRELPTRREELRQFTLQADSQIRNLEMDSAAATVTQLRSQANLTQMQQLLGVEGLVSSGLDTLLQQIAIQEGINPDPASNEALRAQYAQLDTIRGQLAQNIRAQVDSRSREYQDWVGRYVFPYGFTGDETQDSQRWGEDSQSIFDGIQNTIRTQIDEYERQQNVPVGLNPTRPQVQAVPLAQAEAPGSTQGTVNTYLPFAPGTAFSINSNNFHEVRERAGGGTRLHAGEDIAVAVGTPLISYVDGVARVRRDADGYGIYVDITDAEGRVHRFAHMNEAHVNDGERVRAGQTFGTSGSTGSGSGPHLHWEIREPGAPDFGSQGVVDPLQWMAANYNQGTGRQMRHGESSTTSVPQDAARIRGGGYIYQDMVYSPDGRVQPVAYTPNNPLRQDFAPTTREDLTGPLRNDPANNFGYAVVAQDRDFRIALARSSTRLGIPAMWLADIMAYESRGFTADAENTRTRATGLIQFMPPTLEGLGRNIRGRGYTTSEVARMTRAEQMPLVENYLQEYHDAYGGFRSVHEVLASIWGGRRLMNLIRRVGIDAPEVQNYSDGDITFAEYTRRLGNTAGRQYRRPGVAPVIHTAYRNGCSTCESLVRSGSQVHPHEAS